MRIALTHDSVGEFGGAERVLLALSEIWPEAPIYTSFTRKGVVAGASSCQFASAVCVMPQHLVHACPVPNHAFVLARRKYWTSS